ncbi:MAG: amidase [Kineosporiaceae bacterium]
MTVLEPAVTAVPAQGAAPSLAVTPVSAAADRLPLTITEAASSLRSGTWTSVGLTEAVIARAAAIDPAMGTYIVRADETALAAAAAADAELASGLDKGPLHGIPLGIKDILATDEAASTGQSLILDPAWGEAGDGPVVARLREAGAVITGKTTTMEYAIGLPDFEKPFPIPRNPFSLSHWPGGSSSGTGSGVTAGMFLGGLGTDTGGSVRMPASWSGISGIKQTFGRVPKAGCLPLGYSYDHVGPMTRSARDCAVMLAVMAGHDNADACSVDVPVDDYVGALTGSVAGLTIGVDFSVASDPGTLELLRAAAAELEAAGATVVEVTLPLWNELFTAVMVCAAEAFAYHRGDLQSRWTDYGSPTRMAISRAIMTTAADFVQAQRVRRAGVKLAAELFAGVDVVLTPTCDGPAPLVDGMTWDGMLSKVLCAYWNALGYPALSVPMGLVDGLPVGLQIAGRPFAEATVLQVGDAYQQLTTHHLTESPLVLEMLAG